MTIRLGVSIPLPGPFSVSIRLPRRKRGRHRLKRTVTIGGLWDSWINLGVRW